MISNSYGIFTNASDPLGWAQNIANLYYDPRPPVFVLTNPAAYPTNYDFRFWVDINRNGRFETNGYQPTNNEANVFPGGYSSLNGEPEFIGVLKNPLQHHSSSNQFIGRYAYMVLPIGKTLDLNYINNWLKLNYDNLTSQLTNKANLANGFARDQGVGSWELNLAGLLDAVSPWAYESNISAYGPYPALNYFSQYNYGPPGQGETYGSAFDDAAAILNYRYAQPYYPSIMAPLGQYFTNYMDFYTNYIDIFCAGAPVNYLKNPIDYNWTNPILLGSYQQYAGTGYPWPGSYQTNMFYDVQDLFDTNKTSIYFTNRMLLASQRTNTFDRYTFQRLLSCIGMGSSPEYGVWVNSNYDTIQSGQIITPILRTKVNINYDNTAQITNANAPYALMPTNLAPWTALGFFTNAADLLLRSQTFMFDNYIGSTNIESSTPIIEQFGINNIPIYRTNLIGLYPTYAGVRYNASIHRMLQLAANIYDATVSNTYASQYGPVRHPSVFRPMFGLYTNNNVLGINVIGYTQVTNTNNAIVAQLSQQFYDLPSALNLLRLQPGASNINIWGIPWVVAANKGLPEFNQYSYQSSILYERKMLFVRKANADGSPDTNDPPAFTNQVLLHVDQQCIRHGRLELL